MIISVTYFFQKKETKVNEEELSTDWWQPDWVRRHDRAAREPKEPLESRILRKQQRFLKSVGLKEKEGSIVFAQTPKEKKRVFEPRYKRDTNHPRYNRESFDQEAHGRMTTIITVNCSLFVFR